MSKRSKAYLLLLTTSVIWGVASPVIKYTLQYIQPFSFLFWRFLICSLVFLPLLLFYLEKKKQKLTTKKILQMAGLGFLGTTLTLSLLFIGYNRTTAIDGCLIYSVAPIIVIAGGAIFLKEKITKKEKMGAVFAFLGSIVTVIQPFLEGKAFALENIYGNILILCSAISWAVYCLLLRKTEVEKKTDPFILTAISFLTGFLTIIPFFVYEFWTTNDYLKSTNLLEKPIFYLDPAALPGLFYMSFLSSLVAYLTYNLGYSLIEASEATIFDYLKPVFAAPIAVAWLGEKITLPFLAGAFLIFLGVFLTEYKPKTKG